MEAYRSLPRRQGARAAADDKYAPLQEFWKRLRDTCSSSAARSRRSLRSSARRRRRPRWRGAAGLTEEEVVVAAGRRIAVSRIRPDDAKRHDGADGKSTTRWCTRRARKSSAAAHADRWDLRDYQIVSLQWMISQQQQAERISP